MYEVFLYSFIVFKSLISDFLLFTLGFVYLQGFSLSQSFQRLVYLINFIGETLAMLKYSFFSIIHYFTDFYLFIYYFILLHFFMFVLFSRLILDLSG